MRWTAGILGKSKGNPKLYHYLMIGGPDSKYSFQLMADTP
jgi:hypothetical protein